VNYQNIPGAELRLKCLNLVQYCKRAGKFAELVTELRSQRPQSVVSPILPKHWTAAACNGALTVTCFFGNPRFRSNVTDATCVKAALVPWRRLLS